MIGDKIKQLRKQNSLSQDTFAEMIGVSRPTISRWERNDAIPDLDYLKRIADIFHVDLEELLKEGYPEVAAEIITDFPKDTDSQSEERGTYDALQTKAQVDDKKKLRVLSLLLVIALIVIVILVPAFIYVMIDRNVASLDNMATETDPERINGVSESSSIVSDKFPTSFHLETVDILYDIDKIEANDFNTTQYKWASKERDWDSEGLAKRLLRGKDCYLDDKDGIYYNKEYAEDHNSLTVQCYPGRRFFYHYHNPDKADWREIYYSIARDVDPLSSHNSWLSNYDTSMTVNFVFGGVQECIDEVLDVFEDVGIDTQNLESHAFYLDHTKIVNDKYDLSSEDDYYVFCFRDSAPGNHGMPYDMPTLNDSTIVVVYGVDGIVDIVFNDLIRDHEIIPEQVDLLYFGGIIQQVTLWCCMNDENIDKYEINDAELVLDYNPNTGDDSLRPMWRFTSIVRDGADEYYCILLFDAVTGNHVKTTNVPKSVVNSIK